MAVLINHGRGLYADLRVFNIGLPTGLKQRGGGRETYNHCSRRPASALLAANM
jgi:hypothetical protein